MACHVLPAVLLAAEGGSNFTDLNFGLTLWTIVLFGLFFLITSKFGWKPLLQVIEERERGVREAVEGAHKANADAQAVLAQHKEMLQQAGREREEILKKAIQEAEQVRADLAAKARAESEQLLERARSQIERDKTLAILELRSQVADLAMEAAGKIVVSSMTPEAQKKLVNEFIANLPEAK